MIFFMGENDYIKMFDLNYIKMLNAVKNNADQLNDYSKLNDRLKKIEDYESLYYDLFQKYKIDEKTYADIRLYNMLCDMYFKDYTQSVCEKKIKYYQTNSRKSKNSYSSVV